ncbi:MAG: DUF6383 domain-containing protein [Parabacteroides sp.]|nr:DUF6383 domain-containing protein [Parabacteroides sp.]
MNKKFSTLVASLLLTTAFGTVQAANTVEKSNTPCGAGLITGAAFANQEQLNAKQFYFVQDKDGKFLSVVEGNGFQAKLVNEPASLDALNHSLWKIEPQVTEDGGVTRFVLTNKATGLYFAYDPTVKDADKNLGGAYPNWKWFENKFAAFGTATELTVVFEKGDKTMYLDEENGVVVAKKVATKDYKANSGLKLKIAKAGTYVLSAADLNKETSKAGVEYMQLNFGEDNENNIFAEKYQAQQLVASNAKNPFEIERAKKAGYTNNLENYLVLNKIDEKGNLTYNYLRIDTSYYKSNGETYKTYNQIASSAASFKKNDGEVATANGYNVIDVLGENLPDDAFRFQFVKNLANDSVWVRSLVEAVELKEATSEGLYNAAASMNTKWTYVHANESVEEGTQADDVHNGAGTNLILSHCTLEGETEKVITFYTCDEGKPAANYVNLMAIDGVSQNYTTIPAGVYVVSVKGTDKKAYENFCSEFGLSAEALQEYTHMPAFQWVVDPVIKNGEMAAVSPVKVINRETTDNFMDLANLQFVKAEGLAANEINLGGTIYVFNAIELTEEGYYRGIAEDEAELETYRLTYLSGLAAANANLEVGLTADETLKVGAEGVDFTLVPTNTKPETYGVADELEKVAYKLMANGKYVVNDADEKGTVKYTLTDDEQVASVFYLKEQNCVDGTHYYALIEVVDTPNAERALCVTGKVGVDDVTAELRPECACCGDVATRTSAFALTKSTTPLYRRLGVTNAEDGLADKDVQNAKIFRVNATAKEYLYEDANSVYSAGKGINFLGVEGKGDDKLAAITVDTAYVRNETTMPQYLFVMGYEYHEAGMMCPENDEHNDADYIAKFGDCGHKVPTQAYATGRYLVNFADSVELAENAADYIWNTRYTRLGFVEAKHIGDTLVIYRNGQPSTAAADSIFLGDNKHNKNGIKNAVFALRLTGTGEADFMIETEGDKKIPTENTGAWVAIKNGVPVVAKYASYRDAIADAEIFNVEATTEEATANEAIEAAGVQIIGGQGVVTVQGAAGKVITVSNILGQTIANQVAASDNVTIAAPAGVVVVAVEGEATKVVVK